MVQKSGAYFSFGDERLGQGRHAARTFLKEHSDLADQLEARIREDAGVPNPNLLPFDPVTGEVIEQRAGEDGDPEGRQGRGQEGRARPGGRQGLSREAPGRAAGRCLHRSARPRRGTRWVRCPGAVSSARILDGRCRRWVEWS